MEMTATSSQPAMEKNANVGSGRNSLRRQTEVLCSSGFSNKGSAFEGVVLRDILREKHAFDGIGALGKFLLYIFICLAIPVSLMSYVFFTVQSDRMLKRLPSV